MKNDLKIFLALAMESPKYYWNNWESNGGDLAYSLQMAEIPFDEETIPYEESEVFFDFEELENTEIQTIHSFNVVSFRQFVEFLDEACIHVSGICETMGILDALGYLPAKCIETDSYRHSFLSIYVCPIYGDKIPSNESFDRFFQLLEKYDGYDLMRMIDRKKRYEETETNNMEA